MEGDADREDAMETTSSVVSKQVQNQTEKTFIINDYQPSTLESSGLNSGPRRSLLPAYPAHKFDTRPPMLLLANVSKIDRDLMNMLSYSGDVNEDDLEFCPFKFECNQDHNFIQSFLIDFYQKLYIDTSHRWQISLSLIDYNLTRLRKCMDKYSIQVGEAAIVSIDELPMALEFYLQIDVDLFFMKTCNFRDAEPRSIGKQKEGLLCQAEPYARYGTIPCGSSKCLLCQSKRMTSIRNNEKTVSSLDIDMIQFSEKQIHRFVNGYEAILNCPANCDTSNIIYALTCPCGEYDYIGSTAKSFYDRIHEHREEGHRIIRELLIGSQNMNFILNQDKRKVELLANKYDRLLYQHSARCRYGLQRFLNKNPGYWCFIPQLCSDVKVNNDAYFALKKKNKDIKNRPSRTRPFADITITTEHLQMASQKPTESQIIPLTASGKPMLFASLLSDMVRSEAETQQLVRDMPDPPMGYGFSIQQREEQALFFQTKKDHHVVPTDFVDLYMYSIVAVLPSDCSRDLRKFIEALFVTHTEAKLNLIGRLTHEHPALRFGTSMHVNWCDNLVHPSFQDDEIEQI